MTLPTELETSVGSLRDKHTALVEAVNSYRSSAVSVSSSELTAAAAEIRNQVAVEERALLGQIARKGRMPSLQMDFSRGMYALGARRLEAFSSLTDTLTFSRSTGAGRFNPQGEYEWVEADVPRLDYDPLTGECRGLLIEGKSTNLFPYSRGGAGLTNSPTYEINAAVAPNGNKEATVWMQKTAEANRYQLSFTEGTYPVGTRLTVSWWTLPLAYSGATPLHIRNPQGFSIISGPDVIATTSTGWVRHSSELEVSSSTVSLLVRLYVNGDVPSDVVPEGGLFAVWGIQVEEGSFATSLIPTEGAAVTRAADVASREFAEEINQREWTTVFRFQLLEYNPKLTGTIFANTTTSGLDDMAPLTIRGEEFSGSSPGTWQFRPKNVDLRISVDDVPAVTGQWYTAAVSARDGEIILAMNGVTIRRLLSAPLLGGWTLGKSRAYYSDQPIVAGELRLYPFAMTEPQLQEITAQ